MSWNSLPGSFWSKALHAAICLILFLGQGFSRRVVGQDKAPTVLQIAVDKGADRAVVYRSDQSLDLFNVSTGKLLRSLTSKKIFLQKMALSNDGHTLVLNDFLGATQVWDMDSGLQIRQMATSTSIPNSIAIDSACKMLALGGSDGQITLADISAGKVMRQWKAHQEAISALAFSADGEYVAAGSWDKTISVWKVSDGAKVAVLTGHTNWVTTVAFDPKGAHVVSGGQDGLVNIWDISSNKCISSSAASLPNVPIATPVSSVIFSKDGSKVFGVAIGFGGMWSADNGAMIRVFDKLSSHVVLVVDKEDGKNIAIFGNDGSVSIINTAADSPIRTANLK